MVAGPISSRRGRYRVFTEFPLFFSTPPTLPIPLVECFNWTVALPSFVWRHTALKAIRRDVLRLMRSSLMDGGHFQQIGSQYWMPNRLRLSFCSLLCVLRKQPILERDHNNNNNNNNSSNQKETQFSIDCWTRVACGYGICIHRYTMGFGAGGGGRRRRRRRRRRWSTNSNHE